MYIIEGSFEVKLPTIWTGGKAHPGSSSGMEKVKREKVKREKIRDGEHQERRQPEERKCRCAKR